MKNTSVFKTVECTILLKNFEWFWIQFFYIVRNDICAVRFRYEFRVFSETIVFRVVGIFRINLTAQFGVRSWYSSTKLSSMWSLTQIFDYKKTNWWCLTKNCFSSKWRVWFSFYQQIFCGTKEQKSSRIQYNFCFFEI